MKKLLMAALIVTTFATSAFAKKPTKVNYFAQKNFTAEFQDASNVSWNTTSDFIKASFVFDDIKMEAFYTLTGEKIGTSRAITLEQLPLKAKRAFAKKYDGYTVKEAILFEGTEETAYFIAAENEKGTEIVKIRDGQLSVFKKANK